MIPEKFLQVLQTLKAGTETYRLIWEDLPDEEMFRTSIAGGLIRIGKIKDRENQFLNSKNGMQPGYSLTLTNHTGAIAAEFEIWPIDQGYDLLADVYTSARLSARGGEQMIDMIINQGKMWK